MNKFISSEDEMLADQLKKDPRSIEVAKRFLQKMRKAGADIPELDEEGLEMFAKGLALKFLLVKRNKE